MLITNAVGHRAAERFRRRFGLTSIQASYDAYGVSGDAHDYLHTLTGTLPGLIDDEQRVLELEEEILMGRAAMPRGLDRVRGAAVPQ